MANIKLTFGNMVFWGDTNSTVFHPDKRFDSYDVSKTGYNKELYDYYINRRDYANAYQYASMFHYAKPEDEVTRRAENIGLRAKAVRQNSFNKNIQSQEDADAMSFSYSVFNQSEYNALDANNTYRKRFEEYKRRLGSGNGKEASKLKVVFAREKQKAFGANWLDWLVKDNPNNFENFKDEFGYDEEYLKNNGINVIDDHGEITLEFDKNNALSNKLLYNIASSQHAEMDGAIGARIYGYDKDGKQISDGTQDDSDRVYNVTGIGVVDQILAGAAMPFKDYRNALNTGEFNAGLVDIKNMRNIINDAKNTQKQIENGGEENRVFNSRIYGFCDEEVGMLQQMLANPELDATTRANINNEITKRNSRIYNLLMGLGLENYDVTTDYFNRKNGKDDLTLRKVNSSQIGTLKDVLTEGLRDAKTTFQQMESGGRFGVLVTIPAKNVLDSKEGKEDTQEHKSIQIFIPGFQEEELKQRIASNPTYAAIQELDLMEAYGGTYKLSDGRVLSAGTYMDEDNKKQTIYYVKGKDGAVETKQASEILPFLEMEKGIEYGYDAYWMKHTNRNGEIINRQNLNKDIAAFAVKLANSIFSGNDIELKQLINENGDLLDQNTLNRILDQLDYETANKHDNARDIYLKLMEKFNWMQ